MANPMKKLVDYNPSLPMRRLKPVCQVRNQVNYRIVSDNTFVSPVALKALRITG